MKRGIVVLLTSCILAGTIHLDELARVPFLLHHFSEHKQQHPADSFWAFLYKHYVVNQKADSGADKKSDSQMPFKSAQDIDSHFSVASLQNCHHQLIPLTGTVITCYYHAAEVLSQTYDIWQPPKIG